MTLLSGMLFGVQLVFEPPSPKRLMYPVYSGSDPYDCFCVGVQAETWLLGIISFGSDRETATGRNGAGGFQERKHRTLLPWCCFFFTTLLLHSPPPSISTSFA